MKKNIIIGVTSIVLAFGAIIGLAKVCAPKSDVSQEAATTQTKAKTKKINKIKKKQAKKVDNGALYRPYSDPKDLRKAGTWKKKSELKKYPKIKPYEKDLTLRVSLKGNRTYLLRKGKVLYTMLSTGGIYKKGKSLTPTGTFRIQNGRGDSFFNYNLGEGAKADYSYNLKEAVKLGRTQGSHGCIRLSVPDSKWIMDHIPDGTKVVIKNN